jgi:hypothetical protein
LWLENPFPDPLSLSKKKNQSQNQRLEAGCCYISVSLYALKHEYAHFHELGTLSAAYGK